MWPPLLLLFLLLPAAHGAPHPAADLQENFPSVLEGFHRPVKSKLKETEACGEKTTRSLAPAVLLAHEVASMWSRSWGRGPVAS
uniref:RB-associated KRAB zinc finger downstream neighbor (non-protein coding) n=1 Tax=Mus musculus TaxID=10090 RepID=A0ABA7IXG2_MOUSE